MPETTLCGQTGCGAEVVWARTDRHLDERTGKMTGGRPMMVDWPLPPILTKAGRLVAEPGKPVPNLGVRNDQWGTLIVRVLSEADPLRADEKAGVPHWVTCLNPPVKQRKRPAARPKTGPSQGQDALDLGLPGAEPAPEPGPLSDASLFPRRRVRRG